MIASFIPPRSNHKKLNKAKKQDKDTYWKPSSIEALLGVFIHVKVNKWIRNLFIPLYAILISSFRQLPADIETKVAERHNEMRKLGLTLQPFIIIQGPDYNPLRAIYVRLDNIMYKVQIFLQGLVVLSKIYFLYNLDIFYII